MPRTLKRTASVGYSLGIHFQHHSLPAISATAHFANKNAAICAVLLLLSMRRLFEIVGIGDTPPACYSY
jgi:hypothetical protein